LPKTWTTRDGRISPETTSGTRASASPAATAIGSQFTGIAKISGTKASWVGTVNP
jgi:hypothetical protein